MYYCNKCQYIGDTGPAHNLPEKLDGADVECAYLAVKLPSPEQLTLDQVANAVANFLPPGFEARVCIERGAGWIELLDDNQCDRVRLPDAADKSLAQQLNDALCIALGWKA